jgi:hypothetical protein
LSTDSTSSSRDDNDLAVPIILIICPIVQHSGVQVRGDPSEEAKVEELVDSR